MWCYVQTAAWPQPDLQPEPHPDHRSFYINNGDIAQTAAVRTAAVCLSHNLRQEKTKLYPLYVKLPTGSGGCFYSEFISFLVPWEDLHCKTSININTISLTSLNTYCFYVSSFYDRVQWNRDPVSLSKISRGKRNNIIVKYLHSIFWSF